MKSKSEEGPLDGTLELSTASGKWEKHVFVKPEKKIRSQESLEQFSRKKYFNYIMIFVTELQASVFKRCISSTIPAENLEPLMSLIGSLENLINDVPPLTQPMRFGNKAFKTWHAKALEVSSPETQKTLTSQIFSDFFWI